MYISRRGSQNGFTVVELLIVIIVVGVLAAITIVAYNGVQNRAKNTAMINLAQSYKRLFVAYHAVNGHLPYPKYKQAMAGGAAARNSFCLGPLNFKDPHPPDSSLSVALPNHDTPLRRCGTEYNKDAYASSSVITDTLGDFGSLPDPSAINMRDKHGRVMSPVYVYAPWRMPGQSTGGFEGIVNSTGHPEIPYTTAQNGLELDGSPLRRGSLYVAIQFRLYGDVSCGGGDNYRVLYYSANNITECIIPLDKYSNEQHLAFRTDP